MSGQLTVDVLALVCRDITGGKLAVGRLGGAVTSGQIVDDETQDVLTRNTVGKLRAQFLDVGDGVTFYQKSQLIRPVWLYFDYCC